MIKSFCFVSLGKKRGPSQHTPLNWVKANNYLYLHHFSCNFLFESEKKYGLIRVDRYSCKLIVWFMVFNATFNNISAISWRSVLLLEETGVPGENNRPVASH
jgi:hypothetical protein